MIKSLLGLYQLDHGKSEILGYDSISIKPKLKSRIGYVPQKFGGYTWMKAGSYLNYIGAFYPNWKDDKVKMLAREWGIDLYKKISELSEGQRQKLSIIQNLGFDPDILILDEPVASLDPAARRDFISRIIEFNSDMEKTILFSTHITSDIERVAADIIFLNDGKIIYNGELADLKENIRRAHLVSDFPFPEKPDNNSIFSYRKKANSVIISYHNEIQDFIDSFIRKFNAEAHYEELNLEEIFLEMSK